MTLLEYAKKVNELCSTHPQAEVIYSSDDEGNNFQKVHYCPVLGEFNDGEFDNKGKTINAICIN